MSERAGYKRDGDEIQLHCPTDSTTDHEVRNIMGVNNNIVSAQASSPIMGVFQDGLIGAKLMTECNDISKAQFMDCIYAAGRDYVKSFLSLKKRVGEGTHLFTGKNLFSVLLPEDFHYSRNGVVIEKGILLEGTIDKKSIGKSYYAIHHRLFKEYSKETASKFLSGVQRLINRFLIFHGFSIGISAFLSTEEFNQQVRDSVNKAMIEADQIINSGESDSIKEFKVNSCLNAVGSDLKLFGNDKNALEIMIKTGAKGTPPNMKQIRAYLGQNTVSGKRIQPEIDNRSRTLPCFERGNRSPETRGFISNCFLNGLTPAEDFFHTMAGREGVINTAVKTQDAGYTARKLVKRLENLVVEHDYSIRNSGHIVSFVYGGDNLNGKYIVGTGEDAGFIDLEAVTRSLGGSFDKKIVVEENIETVDNDGVYDGLNEEDLASESEGGE